MCIFISKLNLFSTHTWAPKEGDSLCTATWGESFMKGLLNNLPIYFIFELGVFITA